MPAKVLPVTEEKLVELWGKRREKTSKCPVKTWVKKRINYTQAINSCWYFDKFLRHKTSNDSS